MHKIRNHVNQVCWLMMLQSYLLCSGLMKSGILNECSLSIFKPIGNKSFKNYLLTKTFRLSILHFVFYQVMSKQYFSALLL